jgi:segregation and condensation protein B
MILSWKESKIFIMPNLPAQLETILFVASKPIAIKKLIKILKLDRDLIGSALEEMKQKYIAENSGIILLNAGEDWQMVSNPLYQDLAEQFLKSEVSGELTRPQLETLTVISYCGPITKPELEQIRGVNCSLIVRNLLVRGLIKESESGVKLLPSYEVTVDYLRYLGLGSVTKLPDYETLHNHEYIIKVLNQAEDN